MGTKEYSRTERIGQLIRRDIASLIQQEINDPRLPSLVSVSTVTISADLAYAKVYIIAPGDQSIVDRAVLILNNAANFLRKRLAKMLNLYRIPKLRFIYDSSMTEGDNLQKLIDEAVANDEDRKPT